MRFESIAPNSPKTTGDGRRSHLGPWRGCWRRSPRSPRPPCRNHLQEPREGTVKPREQSERGAGGGGERVGCLRRRRRGEGVWGAPARGRRRTGGGALRRRGGGGVWERRRRRGGTGEGDGRVGEPCHSHAALHGEPWGPRHWALTGSVDELGLVDFLS
jgi:hypothetical protein